MICWSHNQGASVLDIVEGLAERKLELLRGRWQRCRGVRAGVRFGLGAGVRVLFPRCLMVGNDVTIEGPAYLHCLSARGVRISSHTSFGRNLWLHCGGKPGDCEHGYFEIGEHSFIGCNAVIGAGGGVRIGNNVLIGQCVNIHAESHIFEERARLIRDQGVSYRGVVIEDDVWIGSKATILDGVTIGRGSIIGAGALVTSSIPPYAVAVGLPARVMRYRGERP